MIAQPRPAAGSGPTPAVTIGGSYGGLSTGTVHAVPVPVLTLDQTPPPPRVKPITTYDPTGRPPLPVPAPIATLPPVPTVPAPPAGGSTKATGGSAGSGGTMSGGGGSVVTTGGAGAPLNLPDLEPLPDAAAPAVDHTTRNLVIAGGVGLAAYFLIFRRRS